VISAARSAAQYTAIPNATLTLSEPLSPSIGSRSTRSQQSRIFGSTPDTSCPSTSTTGVPLSDRRHRRPRRSPATAARPRAPTAAPASLQPRRRRRPVAVQRPRHRRLGAQRRLRHLRVRRRRREPGQVHVGQPGPVGRPKHRADVAQAAHVVEQRLHRGTGRAGGRLRARVAGARRGCRSATSIDRRRRRSAGSARRARESAATGKRRRQSARVHWRVTNADTATRSLLPGIVVPVGYRDDRDAMALQIARARAGERPPAARPSTAPRSGPRRCRTPATSSAAAPTRPASCAAAPCSRSRSSPATTPAQPLPLSMSTLRFTSPDRRVHPRRPRALGSRAPAAASSTTSSTSAPAASPDVASSHCHLSCQCPPCRLDASAPRRRGRLAAPPHRTDPPQPRAPAINGRKYAVEGPSSAGREHPLHVPARAENTVMVNIRFV
jgi:hypothetical protein